MGTIGKRPLACALIDSSLNKKEEKGKDKQENY